MLQCCRVTVYALMYAFGYCLAGFGEPEAQGIRSVMRGKTPSDSKNMWVWNAKTHITDGLYLSHCLQRAADQVSQNDCHLIDI